MKRNSGFGVHNTKRNASFADFLRRGLTGFLAASTAVMMLSGSAASLYAEESATEYALAGAGSGQDVTVHFGDDENQDISIHINAETDEDAALAGLGSELTDETESESTGLKEVEAGDLVTISPVDGSDLPEEAEAGAAIVEGEEAIAAVETKVEEEGSAEAETDSSADSGNSAASQAAGNVGIANTQYQVFDISLDHVDTEQYEDGFKVAVNLPDNIKGARDFHLYHLHEGEEPREIDLTTVESVDKKTGLEVVSGFEFVTEGFSEFVLKYTVDFYYDVDGKTLEYHIVGGSVQSLRDLLQILNIAADNPATEDDDLSVFMNNIENVTFSDESLVKPVCVSENTTAGAVIDALGKEVEYSAELTKDNIAQIRAMRLTAPDWALVSLKPFQSDESLTITMKNGDVVTIKVRDGWDNVVLVSPSYAGTIDISGTDRGNAPVARLIKTNENKKNQYRFSAVAKPGYVFSGWKEDYGNNNWQTLDAGIDPTEPTVLKDTMSMDIFNSRNHNLIAVFEEVHRRIRIEDGSEEYGKVLVPGPYYVDKAQNHMEAWYGSNWNNGSGKNSQKIEAIPNGENEFVRWNYYEETKSNVFTRKASGDLTQRSFEPGTFNLDPNGGKGWFYKAVFRPAPYHFSVDVVTSDGGTGNYLTSKYFDEPNHNNNVQGTNYSGQGRYNDKYGKVTQATFNYGFTMSPAAGYESAFTAYEGQDGLLHQLFETKTSGSVVSEILNTTVIPFDYTEYHAYFTPKGKKLFIYQSANSSLGSVSKSSGYSDEEGATAIPTNGNAFFGWFDENGTCISHDVTFVPQNVNKSMVLTARFGPKTTVTVNVSVNDQQCGDIYLPDKSLYNRGAQSMDHVSGDDGSLAENITAVPREGYAFCYWELNGTPMGYASSSIGPNQPTPVYFQNNDQLKAVFKKTTVVDANGNAVSDITVDPAEKQKFEHWLESLDQGEPLSASKTAKVYEHDNRSEYNNRIYQVDIDAVSARVAANANIGVAFILDASNSMMFPAHLVRTGHEMVLTQENLNEAFPDDNGPYYIISDPTGTSTVIRIYKENGIWYSVDASYYDDPEWKEARQIAVKWDFSFVESDGVKQNVPLVYPIYKDADNGQKQRKDSLNESLTGTINAMRQIVNQVNQGTGNNNYKISVAYDTFAAYTKHWPATRPSPEINFEWVDFTDVNNVNVNLGNTGGGTRQDKGIEEALTFNWNSVDAGQKYAILITDGASVIGSGSAYDNKTLPEIRANIATQAELLKQKGVKLITVGLSTKNVVGGSNILKSIASDGLFFEAETGEDLQNILYQIVQTVVKNGTSCGSITDEVDEAFYPVLADGTPIPRGTSYYKADGTLIDKEDYDRLGPWNSRYKWEETDGKWKITWENQYIGWNPTDSDPRKQPWEGTFYVKAKENFLGGNTISTNDSCTVVEDGYTFDDTLIQNVNNWVLHDSALKPSIALDTPYVNVDELALTQNSTEWTVYLGTSVDPLTQLKDLYSKIDVLKVVSENTGDTDEMITDKSQMLGDKINGRSETFKLGSVVSGLATLNDDEWSSLINNETVTKPYSHYSHDNVGNIQIKLTKQETVSGEPGLNPSPHNTAVVEEGVEKYIFTVTYVPEAESTPRGGWHTTPGGSRGEATGNMESTNNHKINVFDRKISVEKTDTEGNKITDYAAKFKLYRQLDTGENDTSSETLTVNNAEVSVVQVGNEIVTTNGAADLPRLPVGGTYYLVETEAPQGFAKLETPIAIQMDLTNRYWSWNAQETSADGTLQDALKPYNWRQAVTITCNDTGWNGNKYQLSVKNQRSVNIRIEKIDESKRSAGRTALTGAMFKLMKWDGTVPESGAEIGYTKFNEVYGASSGISVDENGVLRFEGLPDGEYEIVETQAPAGFIKVDNVIYFKLQGGVVYRHSAPTSTGSEINWGTDIQEGNENEVDCVTYTRATVNSEATFVIGNTPGSVLPATGGEGTRMIYLLGIALMALAGAGFILVRRRKERAA